MQHDWPALLTSALIIISACVLLEAARRDFMTRTVPNWMAIALVVLGTASRALDGTLSMGLLAGAITFIAAAFCWRRGWLGGADVKLLGAAAVVVPPHDVLAFITAVALAGAVLGVGYLAARRLLSAPPPRRPVHLMARALRVERWRIRRGGPLPYACAIAAGFLFIIL